MRKAPYRDCEHDFWKMRLFDQWLECVLAGRVCRLDHGDRLVRCRDLVLRWVLGVGWRVSVGGGLCLVEVGVVVEVLVKGMVWA